MKYAIFLNGEYPEMDEKYIKLLEDRLIYCADGGANKAYKLGLVPEAIIGDLDSIKSEVLEYYSNLGVNIKSYSSDKDYTDFEIVLMHICNLKNVDMNNRFKLDYELDFYQNKDIIVFGSTGKRIDMSIANLRVLMHNKNMKYISHTDDIIYFIDGESKIHNMENKRFGLIPLENIKSLTLKGFMYNLENRDIDYTKALVSNVILDKEAYINFDEGKALISITLK